jgi:hypothetical protein
MSNAKAKQDRELTDDAREKLGTIVSARGWLPLSQFHANVRA